MLVTSTRITAFTPSPDTDVQASITQSVIRSLSSSCVRAAPTWSQSNIISPVSRFRSFSCLPPSNTPASVAAGSARFTRAASPSLPLAVSRRYSSVSRFTSPFVRIQSTKRATVISIGSLSYKLRNPEIIVVSIV